MIKIKTWQERGGSLPVTENTPNMLAEIAELRAALAAQQEIRATAYSALLPCNEVPPGNGYCVECANGNYEKCLYVTRARAHLDKKAAAQPTAPVVPRDNFCNRHGARYDGYPTCQQCAAESQAMALSAAPKQE